MIELYSDHHEDLKDDIEVLSMKIKDQIKNTRFTSSLNLEDIARIERRAELKRNDAILAEP